MLHTVWIWTTICPILTKSNLLCRQAQLSSDLSNIFIYFRSNLLNNNATLCWSLLFPYRYVSNDNCLGRQPLLRTWWNTKMIRQTILVNFKIKNTVNTSKCLLMHWTYLLFSLHLILVSKSLPKIKWSYISNIEEQPNTGNVHPRLCALPSFCWSDWSWVFLTRMIISEQPDITRSRKQEQYDYLATIIQFWRWIRIGDP